MTKTLTKALILTGSVCAGKSTLSQKLHGPLQLRVISEGTIGNYYKIMDRINPYYIPNGLFEHVWIYRKWFLFKAVYDRSMTVVLDVDENLLKKNFEKRLEIDKVGDFRNMDPVETQKEILSDIKRFEKDYVDVNNQILHVKIGSQEDYGYASDEIIKSFTKLIDNE